MRARANGLDQHEQDRLHEIARAVLVAQMTKAIEPHPRREPPTELRLDGARALATDGGAPHELGVGRRLERLEVAGGITEQARQ